jgi:pyruvate,water dikinase
VLTPAQAAELAGLGRRIEALFGAPQDVEWAVADGRTGVLQARPITPAGAGHASASSATVGRVLVTGVAASPGVASGRANVVLGLDGFERFVAGDVLVCHATSPAWTPLLASAAAVVTETGGMLAHAAIVAREFGIPAVLAAPGAATVLARAGTVVVDGDRGIVAAERTSERNR